MIERIDHISIVVKDLEKAIKVYSEALGLKVKSVEHIEAIKVKLAFIPVGDVMIELIEPMGPGMFQDFIEGHGEGLHHICFKVTDIDKALEDVGKKLKVRDKEPRPGRAGARIAFLDRIFNVETEFVERKER